MKLRDSFDGSFNEFLELFKQGKVLYGPWWKHVDDCVHRKNVHVVHFEELCLVSSRKKLVKLFN
jgi:hypothetical protein